MTFVTDRQALFADDEIHRFFDHRTLLIILSGNVVRPLVMFDHFIGTDPENKDIVISHQSVDFHIGTVVGSQCHGTV